MKEQMKDIMQNIKHNGEMVKGRLFSFANQDSGMMESYNAIGQLISSRRLKPEERQLNLIASFNPKREAQ